MIRIKILLLKKRQESTCSHAGLHTMGSSGCAQKEERRSLEQLGGRTTAATQRPDTGAP